MRSTTGQGPGETSGLGVGLIGVAQLAVHVTVAPSMRQSCAGPYSSPPIRKRVIGGRLADSLLVEVLSIGAAVRLSESLTLSGGWAHLSGR